MNAEPANEIHRAHPRHAFLTFGLLAGGIVLGLLVQTVGHQWVDSIAQRAGKDPAATVAELTVVVRVFSALLAGSLLAGAFMLARYGRKVVAERRFPTERTVALRDVPVLRGERAEARGRLLTGTAALLGVAALVLPFAIERFLSTFLH